MRRSLAMRVKVMTNDECITLLCSMRLLLIVGTRLNRLPASSMLRFPLAKLATARGCQSNRGHLDQMSSKPRIGYFYF